MEGYTEIPQESGQDKAYAITKGILGAVPVVGSLLSEFYSMVVVPPLQERKDAFIENLYYDLKFLEQRFEQYRDENLSQNQQFITTFMAAAQIAIRTHYQEKLEALRNAVLNSVIQEDINYQQSIFLNIIDAINPLHILIINSLYNEKSNYISSPDAYERRYKFLNQVEVTLNSKAIDKEISTLILNDLLNRGLINKLDTETEKKRSGGPVILEFVRSFDVILSPFGEAFYHFITRPESINSSKNNNQD